MKTDDNQVMRSLIHQVSLTLASMEGVKTERNVTTFITRPMWNSFLRAVGEPEDSEPSEWNAGHSIRVYGSRTVVVESVDFWAVSMPGNLLPS